MLSISFAQKQSESEEIPRFYLRKSISYYDGILIGKTVTVDDSILNIILTRLNKTLSMERFDFNPIPTNLQQNLQTEINNLDSLTLDNLSNSLERTFVPEIVKILNIVQASRTESFVSEQERTNFLTSKAKEVGVTADDIEKVMNAAYIYIPFITHYGADTTTTDNLVTISIDGGIIWYNVATKFTPPRVIPITQKSTLALGNAQIGKNYFDFATGKKLDAVTFANNSAIKTFLRNIQVLTREIPEFRLSADVFSVNNGNLYFKLGRKEGIKVDDKFNLGEFFEDENGIRKFKTIGCVLVNKVVNNADTMKTEIVYSQAKPIIGKPEAGMTIIERPRLPIDVLLGYATILDSDISGMDLEFDYNIGRYFGISQLYFPINMLFAPTTETDYYSGETETKLSLYQLGFGLMKKFYWQRFSVGGMGSFILSTVDNGSGGEINGITEFRLIPDLSLGAKLGYSLGNNQGLTWGVRLGYNPPTLPFDPFETLRGLMGI